MAVDQSGWDGNRAMGMCSGASDYRSICAAEHITGTPDQRQHWALPHHFLDKGPNADGVRASLSRVPQTQDITDAERAKAQRHLEAHMSEINPANSSEPPRESLYRAMWPGAFEFRDLAEGPPTMVGHFAVFNQWTRIDSMFEGEFMERIAPGSFTKTFEDRAGAIRVLFQHGRDPNVGSKVLGPAEVLREDELGAAYEVPLLDTSYNRDLLPGLRAGLYGASFRFRVLREELVDKPKVSDANPQGLPERTIKEIELHEFGPVTFPAYDGATAGIRSLTDEFMLDTLVRDKTRLRNLIRYLESEPVEPDAARGSAPSTSDDGDAAPGSVPSTSRRDHRDYLSTRKEEPSWTL